MPLLLPLGVIGSGKEQILPYWVASFASDSNYENTQGVAVDSNGNSYCVGYRSSDGGGNEIFVGKLNSFGEEVWQKTYSNVADEAYGTHIVIDGNDEPYIAFNDYSSSQPYAGVMKLNASGDILWQKRTGNGSSSYNSFHDQNLSIDPFGNTYIVMNGPGTYEYNLARYNSGGFHFTSMPVPSHSQNGFFDQIAQDSNQDVLLGGDYSSSGSFPEAFPLVAKMNENRTQAWSRFLQIPSTAYGSVMGIDTSFDGNNDVYVCGYVAGDPGQTFFVKGFVAKFNSSGTFQWGREIDNGLPRRVSFSQDGNVYVWGNNSNNNEHMFLKYNSSGSLQWQRQLNIPTNTTGSHMTTDSSGNIYLTVGKDLSNNPAISVVKLPGDGSLTGTYGSIVYAASSLSESALSYSFASTTVNYQDTSVANSNASLSAQIRTLPFDRSNIG